MKGIISAEIFNDFLERAKHLLETGYKDPAAVMIGSVFEEHLRQLATSNHIEITQEKKDKLTSVSADRLNNELAKNEIYNKLEHKSVLAILDLRNKGSHGHYNEYDKTQVKLMLSSFINFINKYEL